MIFPTPFFSRGPVYRGPINYIAVFYTFAFSGGVVSVTPTGYRVSKDGLMYRTKAMGGDVATYQRSNQGGAFVCAGGIKFGSLIFLYGQIWDDGNNSRCGLFVSTDGAKSFNRLQTAVDGVAGASGGRSFVDAVVLGSSVVFLSSTGELAWTSDGVNVSTRANLGFTGSGVALANSIAAGEGFLIAAGKEGQAFSVTTPGGAATARNLQFGTTTIEKIRAGNLLVAVGAGKISTCLINNPSTWTLRTDPVGGSFDYLGYEGGRWFAAGLEGKWITSPTGAEWSVPSNKPNASGQRVRSIVGEPSRILVFMNDKVAVTEDFTTWNLDAGTGLPASFFIALKVA